VAAADRGEPRNERAKAVLLDLGETPVTSDLVLAESWLLIRRRLHQAAADRFWEALRGAARLEPISAGDLEVAWSIRQGFPDQRFSLVDLTSFALMQRLGIHRVATFDRDFAVYRFGPRRERAFTVLG
jgi:predicted nucleic acid-binding protein